MIRKFGFENKNEEWIFRKKRIEINGEKSRKDTRNNKIRGERKVSQKRSRVTSLEICRTCLRLCKMMQVSNGSKIVE